MITHGKSAYTFFIPYADAGGAKNSTSNFFNILKQLFHSHALPILAAEVEKLSMQNITFTKTVDRKNTWSHERLQALRRALSR